MKKTVLAISLSLISSISQAKPQSCNYSDYIHLSSDTPTYVKILNLTSDSNVKVEQKDARSFYIKDADTCPPSGGNVEVRYGDTTHYCDLKIHDGELEFHPEVTASCHDLAYNGLTYDGFVSYSYSLHFAKTN